MAFLPNIPQSTDQLSVSQGNILNNFGILGAIAGNTNAGSAAINNTSGFNFINLPVNAIPPVVFPAGNVGLYAGLNPTTNKNELYINKTNQVTVTQIPATASVLSVTSAPAQGTAGWTYLPSGLLLKWGSQAGPFTANVPGIITITVAGSPAFTNILAVIPYAQSSLGNASYLVNFGAVLSNTQFSIATTTGVANTGSVYYLAIGY